MPSERTYPLVIENGAGERLTFLRRVPGARGDRLEGENMVAPGAGPPMHVHHFEDEGFTVLEGRLGYQVHGQPPGFAEEGGSVDFPAGVPHRFWNAGDGPLRCAGYVEPAGNTEYFLGALFESQRRSGGHRPNLLDAAYLCRRYRSEFGFMMMPGMVQQILFPILIGIGRVLGRYGKYADAPEPIRSGAEGRRQGPPREQYRLDGA